MKYVAIWFAAFIGMSAADAVWHLGIFGWAYGPDFKAVARVVDGKMSLQPIPGIISQVLVVSSVMVITILGVRAGQGYPVNVLVGALGGVLAISVYGLVNQALTDRLGVATHYPGSGLGPDHRRIGRIVHRLDVPGAAVGMALGFLGARANTLQ